MSEKNNKIYEFGDFRLDVAEQNFRREGEVVTLAPKVFDLLAVLVENHGHLLSKDELIKALWADSFVEEANLNVTVSALRKALGEKPNENRFIETVPRRGYRFVAEVRQIKDTKEEIPIPQTDENLKETLSDADTVSFNLQTRHCPKCRTVYTDETLKYCLIDGEILQNEAGSAEKFFSEKAPSKTIKFKNIKILVAVGGFLLILAGIWVWTFVFQTAKTDVSGIKTIAVLPFKPLVNSQSDGALEMGMADALITKLSRIQQITVRPTGSISKYAETNTDPVSAGKELQVEAVLDGKVQRADNKIRISVQLLRVADGALLWAGSFDDFFTNIFAVQDSISEKVTAKLALKISGQEKESLAKRPTENTEAYALYLQGRYFHEQISIEGSRKALEYYDQAVQKDPEFALAYSWMVGALLHLAGQNINREENYQKARFVANRAVELDPNLSDAHEALATVKSSLDWDFAGAEAELKKAIELDPKNSDVRHSFALLLSQLKRHDEAFQQIEIALQISPTTMYIQNQVIYILYRARRYDEAITYARQAIDLKPDNSQAYNFLIQSYIKKSMPTEASAALKKFVETFPKANPRYLTALVYRAEGKKAEADKILRELAADYQESDNNLRYAHIYALLGDKDRAFELLEKAFQRRDIQLLLLSSDPQWDEIRSDPRFQDLVKRIGLPN